jgi:MFS family permease
MKITKILDASKYVTNTFMMAAFLSTFAYQMLMILYPLTAIEESSILYLGFLFLMPAIVQVIISYITGRYSKHINKYKFLFIFYSIILLGVLLPFLNMISFQASDEVLLLISFIIIGAGIAGIGNLENIIVPIHFKEKNLGKVNSYLSMVSVLAMIIAPLLTVKIKSVYGLMEHLLLYCLC